MTKQFHELQLGDVFKLPSRHMSVTLLMKIAEKKYTFYDCYNNSNSFRIKSNQTVIPFTEPIINTRPEGNVYEQKTSVFTPSISK